jgi:hypothetical protein
MVADVVLCYVYTSSACVSSLKPRFLVVVRRAILAAFLP